jgi:phosphoribosyl 1,2-cyclic phosphodiesterase
VNLVEHFKSCHAAFLESNYDEEMLENGNYPFYLKKRISGNMGHLSNRQALQLFLLHRSSSLSHLVLSHLSRENNSPQLVQKLFAEHAGDTHVTVASRDYESNVFHVTGNQITDAPPVGRAAQMSLF